MTRCREADHNDLGAILRLYQEAQIDDSESLALSDAQTLFSRMKSYPNYHLYVAEEAQQIIGSFALLIMDNLGHRGTPSAIVEDVAVHPGYQRQGIGKDMMQFAIQLSRDAGCYKIVLSSNLKREKAHAFYEALGFEKHGYSYRLNL